MIQDISEKISWLKKHPLILKGIFRGIERETLRIQKNGKFSKSLHPNVIGSPLTHKWITTDFAENLLEFVTPASNNVDYLLSFLKDLHSFVALKIKNERMWPFSIPYCYDDKTNIKIAQYGTSNVGRKKTTYRIGLKTRYGDLVNTISGVHYNFSLPVSFWEICKEKNNIESISSGYLNLIRNYYRFGWIIPYLFGTSPAISSYFLKNAKKKYQFKKNKENIFYLPWSTSLRLSDIGYTSTKITDLNIMFNDLSSYLESLKNTLITPSKKFAKIGVKDINGNFQQLNTNILQMENELYTQIRPKRKTHNGELLIEALQNKGIEYVEIRSLDINPFSSIGINKNQILLLDLFLIWCALMDSPNMDREDFLLTTKNWEKIIFEGRKPNQKIYINQKNETKTLVEIGETIFKDLNKIACILDSSQNNVLYQTVCKKIILFFKNPELTYSAQFLKNFIKKGVKKTGLALSNKYHEQFIHRSHKNFHKNFLEQEVIRSHQKQKNIEKEDILSFEDYIQT
ncbi:MAG: glutamate--cysteine ligase [Buchnera aphidicola (Brevicoryne brassicae)]|uniref:Glutamate--cysteine ligase n=1 Tax=Buchnera aphidicola (Brevicoryne brassicae) TaxID=911343 RepID=A0AAJ5PUQ3_9GAMM|nr:glutamate--cysteine ligase [Buchnera aphidicola]QCI19963.1 glutamate--cysteine ligase [Buchnera aphidicola (Brevicoryne brassicae)]WAI18787.1 MAG: glutamate--cysteine ligase [Buchnera aphidicola (Brevicoryne brassicae)]